MQFGDAYLQASQDAHADPCPLSKAPTEAKCTSEVDCRAKEEAGLMNDVLFYIMWMAECMCVAYIGNHDALWEEGKPVETQFGQCSTGKLGVHALTGQGSFGSKRGTNMIS